MNRTDHENFWSARYRDAGENYLFGTSVNRFLANHAELFTADAKVLSVADGEGRNSVWLALEGMRVTATEISPVALEKARKLAAVQHVSIDFVQADAVTWDYSPETFDYVVGIFIQFASPTERSRMFDGMKRALKPGGYLLLQGYTPKQLEYRTGGPSVVENLYTEEMLRAAFADLEIIELRSYEDVLDEGAGHSGRSALIGLVAHKPE